MPDIDPLITFARDLVRIPSVLGDAAGMARRVAAELEEVGADEVEIDQMGNVVGVFAGARSGPQLLFDAHMDTVDVTPRQAWSVDPFGGVVDRQRLWGRGASDMKGALAAMVHAAGTVRRDRLGGRLIVVGSVEEERIEGAALRPVCERYRPDVVIIGEASDLQLVRAGRGRAEFVLEAVGRPAHASTPHLGIHAVHRLMDVVREIEALPVRSHAFVGSGVTCLTDIISQPHPAHSVVPSGCRATVERRLVPGETQPGVMAEFEAACARAGAPDTRIELARARLETWTGRPIDEPKWLPPWELPEDDALFRVALEALDAAGLTARPAAYQFCTNAAYTAGIEGIATLGFGPGREDLAHIVDEYLEVEQLLEACRGYRALAEAVLPV